MRIGNCLIGAIILWFHMGGTIMCISKKSKKKALDFIPHFCLQSGGMVYDFTVDMELRAFDFILIYDGWWRCSSKAKVISRWGDENNLLNFDH